MFMNEPAKMLRPRITVLQFSPPGRDSATNSATSPADRVRQDASGRRYAGFWARFLAYLIDGLVLTLLVTIIYGGAYMALSGFFHQPAGPNLVTFNLGGTQVTLNIAVITALALVPGLSALFYLAVMESSDRQATFGKLAMGLKVTDLHGGRISFWRAIGRELAKIISSPTFGIGFIIAGFSKRKQALHDVIARTVVVSAREV
jgi:uncharacterized RDD family membrane protein YckC